MSLARRGPWRSFAALGFLIFLTGGSTAVATTFGDSSGEMLLVPYQEGDDLGQGCALVEVTSGPAEFSLTARCDDGDSATARLVPSGTGMGVRYRSGRHFDVLLPPDARERCGQACLALTRVTQALLRNDTPAPRVLPRPGESSAVARPGPPPSPNALAALSAPWLHLEVYLWWLLGMALPFYLFGLGRDVTQARQWRVLMGLIAVGLVARLCVPFVPINWYYPMQEGLAPPEVFFTRSSSALPLPFRWLLFHSGLGPSGAHVVNFALSLLLVPLAWTTAYRASESTRVAAYMAGFLALIPVYVRYAATDSPLVTSMFLFALAASAYLRWARTGRAGVNAAVVFCAVALLVPIRAETLIAIGGIPLLLFRGRFAPRDVFPGWTIAAVFITAVLFGLSKLLPGHLGIVSNYLNLPVASVIFSLVQRLTFSHGIVGNVFGPGALPGLLAVPTWFLLARLFRSRDWRGLLTVWLPTLLVGFPFAFGVESPGHDFITELELGGAHANEMTFMLLVMARAAAELHERLQAGALIPPARRRVAAVVAALLVVPVGYRSLYQPYRWLFAYQEEYRFLAEHLPKGPGTIVTMWDPYTGTNDLDCCLSMPYPALWLQNPELRWINLGRRDLEGLRIEELRFDYFYPGLIGQLDRDATESFRTQSELQGRRKRIEMLVRHVDEVRALEARVRAAHPLTPLVERDRRASTFGSLPFPGDRMTLKLYRRSARGSASLGRPAQERPER